MDFLVYFIFHVYICHINVSILYRYSQWGLSFVRTCSIKISLYFLVYLNRKNRNYLEDCSKNLHSASRMSWLFKEMSTSYDCLCKLSLIQSVFKLIWFLFADYLCLILFLKSGKCIWNVTRIWQVTFYNPINHYEKW